MMQKKSIEKNLEDILPLIPIQEGMLFHRLKDSDSAPYVQQLCLKLSGNIDIKCFMEAWAFVTASNEMLRTVFRWEKMKKPVQMVLKHHTPHITFVDLSNQDNRDKKQLLENLKTKDRKEKFLLHDVPFRITLCKIEPDQYELIISNHHILYDGWSTGIVLKEFINAYKDLSCKKKPVTPVKNRYKEFIKRIRNQDLKEHEKFWKNYLEGFEAPAGFPLKKGNKRRGIIIPGQYQTRYSGDKKELEIFVKKHKITLASLFYSVWGILLQKYYNCNDIIFGTTVSGRSGKLKGIENIVGLFINTLPLRVQTHAEEKIVALLQRIWQHLQRRERYEHTPLVMIKKYMESPGREDIFDSIVVIKNYPLDKKRIQKNSWLTVTSHAVSESSSYDLTLSINMFDDLEFHFSYNKEIWERETIERLSIHFLDIFLYILHHPQEREYQE